jgi:hypothetical protein
MPGKRGTLADGMTVLQLEAALAKARQGEDAMQAAFADEPTRSRRIACPNCGYTARTSAKWIRKGLPTCSCGTRMIVEPAGRKGKTLSRETPLVMPTSIPVAAKPAVESEIKRLGAELAMQQTRLTTFIEAGQDRNSAAVANTINTINELSRKLGIIANGN